MKQASSPIPQPDNPIPPPACRARLLGNSAIVECLMEEVRCQWAAYFRDGRICKHPAAEQFVTPVQE